MKGRRRKTKVGARKAAPRRPAGRARPRVARDTGSDRFAQARAGGGAGAAGGDGGSIEGHLQLAGKLEPVFQAMLENAVRICERKFGDLCCCEGDDFRCGGDGTTCSGRIRQRSAGERRSSSPPPRHRPAACRQDRSRSRCPICMADNGRDQSRIAKRRAARARSSPSRCSRTASSSAPSASTGRRSGRSPRSRSNWCQNFAAQAVIAIENTRLLNELRQRTDDLSESLWSSRPRPVNILSVISSSPTDVQPTLDAIVRELRCRLCNSHDAVILLRDGELSWDCGPSRVLWAIDFEGATAWA